MFRFSKRWEGTERRFVERIRVFLIWRWVLLGQDVIPGWQPNSFGLLHNHGSGTFPQMKGKVVLERPIFF